MVSRASALAAILLLAATGAPAREAEPADDLLVLVAHLDGQLLADDLLAYGHPGGVLLPLQRLAELLELPLDIDPEGGRAEGWIGSEERRASLDLERREWTLGDRAGRFEPAQARVLENDLYLDADLLSSWLPVDFAVDHGALELEVSPRERLAIQERWAREARRRDLQARSVEEGLTRQPRFALEDHPYQLVGWPTIDGSVGFHLGFGREGWATSLRPSLLARGDLLAATAGLLISGDEARLTLERPVGIGDGNWKLGDLSLRPDPLVSRGRPGRGVLIAHAPGSVPIATSERTVLAGDALPGWEVELYRDGTLLDFRTIGDDGRYEFRDIPLKSGQNRFRLVFHGPRGERREQEERVFLPADLLPPGAMSWHLGLLQTGTGLLRAAEPTPSGLGDEGDEVRPGSLLGSFELERGVSRRLSWGMGLTSLTLDDERHDYVGFGLRTSLAGGAGQLRFTRDLAGGWAGQLQARATLGPVQLEADQVELRSFQADGEEAGDLRSRTRVRLFAQAPLPGRLFSSAGLPVSLTATRRVTAGSESLAVQATSALSLTVGSTILGNRWQLGFSGANLSAGGSLLLNGRLRGLRLRGNLDYQLAPEPVLSGLAIQTETSLRRNLAGRLALSQSLQQALTSLSAGVDWKRDDFILGATLGLTSQGRVELGGALSFSLGRDPQDARLRIRGEAGASQGTVSARVFLDADNDGRFGPGDSPLPGVKLDSSAGVLKAETAEDGIAWMRVPPHRPVDLSVSESSLADPSWLPARRGVSLVPRPGTAWAVDFPVVVTGEIDGTVYLLRGGTRREASNVRVQLCDATGAVVQEARSQFDGFYLFERVPPGRYTLRVEAGQLERLKLAARIESAEIDLRSGEIRRGVEIELREDP